VSSFDQQQEAIKRQFSSAPPASPVVSCPKGALTEQEAKQWFDDFKHREEIPWNYPNDCCYNRAHVMARELHAVGVDVGKVWNYAPSPNIGDFLRVATPNDPKGYVEWGYHVAPTVPVTDPRGQIHRMVIDPSIANTPITPDQWKALQGQPLSKLVATNASPYYRDQNGRAYAGVDPTNRQRPPTHEEVQAIFDRHRRARALNWIGKE
jgi:hypothetical protein